MYFVTTMENGLSRTVWHAAALRRSALAAIAVVASTGLVGCASGTTDTAKAAALFRQMVERQYDVTAARCARTAHARWICAARINNPAKEIDIDVHSTVWRADGQWSASGSTAVLSGLPPNH
jgi:hypothetical protein